MPAAARGERAGVVFQFPERHFVGSSIHGELTLSWPRNGDLFQRQVLAQRLFQVSSTFPDGSTTYEMVALQCFLAF